MRKATTWIALAVATAIITPVAVVALAGARSPGGGTGPDSGSRSNAATVTGGMRTMPESVLRHETSGVAVGQRIRPFQLPAARNASGGRGSASSARDGSNGGAGGAHSGGSGTSGHPAAPNPPVVASSLLDGRAGIVDFFSATCMACRSEATSLSKIYTHNRYTIGVVAIDEGDGAGAVASFDKSLAIPYPVALDSGGTVAALYGIVALPTTIVVSPGGAVTQVHIGAATSAQLSSWLQSASALKR